jgi:GNAT superfamily N-acetyltransferase
VTASSSPVDAGAVEYRVSPPLGDEALNALFDAAWGGHGPTGFGPVLARSLAWVAAFAGGELVGFVNVAWDGGAHAFLLDTTVHPRWQRHGVGTALVRHATAAARARGAEWLHVDYEPHLSTFYRACGFRPTDAGLIHLPEV